MREKKVDAAYRDLNDFPDQHTLILQDWWPQPFMDVFTVMHSAGNYYPSAVGELSTIGSPYSTSNLPDGSDHGSIPFYSGLINGKGKHRDVPYAKSRLATFKVDYMKSYRFRVIGGQSLFGYWFLHCHLDTHHMEGMAMVLNIAEVLQKKAPLGMTSCRDFKLPLNSALPRSLAHVDRMRSPITLYY